MSRSPAMSSWYRERQLKAARTPFTMPELNHVRKLAAEGLSSRQIGLIVRRSTKSIYSACRYHRIALHARRGRPAVRDVPLSSTDRSRLWRGRRRALAAQRLADAAD